MTTEGRYSSIVLDASLVIAHFNDDDTHHQAADSILDTHASALFIMHTLTLAECLVVPARARQTDRAVFRLMRLGVQEWNRSASAARDLAELRVETGLKMPDVCVLDAALGNNAALATFDVELAKVARSFGLTVLDG